MPDAIPRPTRSLSLIEKFFGQLPDLLEQLISAAIAAGIAIAVALVAHAVLFAILGKIARASQRPTDDEMVRRLRQPLRWGMMAVTVSLAAEANVPLGHVWGVVARFVVPALLGWTALSLIKAFAFALDHHAEVTSDDMTARSRRTRIAILSRSAAFVIVFITVALMLLGIPGVRNVGVTLMASAGLAGLAVGAAAQPALKSLIAGIQMALTEPIRLGDHIVVEGEGGRVEEIRMTYVVIRIGDDRRLIVPTAKFLDATFQNWTRVSGGITGTVLLPIKPCHPIAPIRAAFERIIADREEWDRRTAALQVAEVKPGSVELKLVMSAPDPGALVDLRLAVREAMIEWLAAEMPDAMCATA